MCNRSFWREQSCNDYLTESETSCGSSIEDQRHPATKKSSRRGHPLTTRTVEGVSQMTISLNEAYLVKVTTMGEGVKNTQKFDLVVYGWPLNSSKAIPNFLLSKRKLFFFHSSIPSLLTTPHWGQKFKNHFQF